jgi:hypothetical protein
VVAFPRGFGGFFEGFVEGGRQSRLRSAASGFAGQLPASLASYAGTRRRDKTAGKDGGARPVPNGVTRPILLGRRRFGLRLA